MDISQSTPESDKQSLFLGKRQRNLQNRLRKDECQIQLLIDEFRHNTTWTKQVVARLSRQSGLSESQVYKWAWDQKKKIAGSNHEPEEPRSSHASPGSLKGSSTVTRDEFGGYCCKRWVKEQARKGNQVSRPPTQPSE